MWCERSDSRSKPPPFAVYWRDLTPIPAAVAYKKLTSRNGVKNILKLLEQTV